MAYDLRTLFSQAKADPTLAARLLLAAEQAAPSVTVTGQAHASLAPLIAHEACECLAVLALNRRQGVLGSAVLTRGNDAHTIVDPRQVLRWALVQGRNGAASIVVAHNHPSGDPSPSNADIEVTHRLVDACRTVGVDLLDHLILTAGGAWTSLREAGLMPTAARCGPVLS